MAHLRIKALPSTTGAPYYRRAGRCFTVGQVVDLDASPEVEAELRKSKRLVVEIVEPAPAAKLDEGPDPEPTPPPPEEPLSLIHI